MHSAYTRFYRFWYFLFKGKGNELNGASEIVITCKHFYEHIVTKIHNNFLFCYSNFQSPESGCLFPSLPSDVKYDETTGISFMCDLNDNVEASWPTTSFVPASSCNNSKLQHNSLYRHFCISEILLCTNNKSKIIVFWI